MDFLSFKTCSLKEKNIKSEWILLDASNQILGRFSSRIASIIIGKHRPFFSYNMICGDHVIVINSDYIKVTGKKLNNKKYIRHTGFPGGQKMIFFKDLLYKDSRKIVYKSVKGMLPKNRLGRFMLKKRLHIYSNSYHKHEAQKPILLKNFNFLK
ncbi:50S ribosomal protein L13 [Blattabacterium cuenoti]|uniref:50S ribosomal protein L13 n=1 Tax=Blattabacterium cuenoti TaxID=1653831 RepID=UPI00163D1B83|nr:50S ribosomal protein L13 [Blattabacterium cuenoti]